MSAFSILIVDDEVSNFDVIEAMLSNQDYQLNYVDTGREAISSLNLFQPDLILLDVMMPEMDGIATCRQIKAMADWQSVPIIMITALNTKNDLARCLDAGADDFISKPVHRIELRARVEAMLRIKQQYDDLKTLMALRENMVDMIIHDLRVPLKSTLSGLELLEQEAAPPAKQQGILEATYSSAQTLETLIDSLLATALIEAGKLRLSRTKVHLGDLIQTLVPTLMERAAEKSQTLTLELPEQPIKSIAIDVDMMRQALEKLMLEMLQMGAVNGSIILKLDQPNSHEVIIRVIDAESEIADSLEQILLKTDEPHPSMPAIAHLGPGLTFCKLVVEAHGGKLGIQKRPPQGIALEITLPLAVAQSPS
ncbi:MAG: hybrid sensor histidine kinase/response regulator [Cyanobacteria bacterium J06626_18]